jgi:signal transduction histidine kinase
MKMITTTFSVKVNFILISGFLSSIRFTYLNKDLHQEQDLSEYSLLKALKNFQSQDRTTNHDLYFIGVIEYIHPSIGEKYYFNVFFRANIIADIKWIEIFMYDITLNQRIETIDKMIKIKEKILLKIAHEFKTPLMCVISLSEKLQNDINALQTYPGFMAEIKQINDLSNYTLLLINDIAFYLNSNSKVLDGVLNKVNNNKFYQNQQNEEAKDVSQIILHKEDIYIMDILKFVYRILETLLIYKGNFKIKAIKDFKENIANLVINTDPLRLKQILLNLISNAVKFTKSGYIILSAKINIDDNYSKELVISVEDSGVGIKEDDMDKLFKDYKILDKNLNFNPMGSGLGLSISNHLANVLGYQIDFKSQYTVGTTFSVKIKLPYYHLPQPRKQSCPMLTCKKTIVKLSNCSFPKNMNEADAVQLIESNKRHINRILSDYLNNNNNNNNKKKFSRRNFLPVNANIVHISNSNFNFNRYEHDNEGKSINVEVISNHESSSHSDEDYAIKAKSEADSAITVEQLYPVNMDQVRKLIDGLKINRTNQLYEEVVFRDERRKLSRTEVLMTDTQLATSKFLPRQRDEQSPVKEIVIVDDNSMLLSSLKNMINKVLVKEKMDDLKITCGSDGIDLLKIIMDDQKNENIIKVVFVDEFMEYMNGSDAIRIIRDLENQSKIKPLYIVKVTAMNLDKTLDGSNLTLEKPVREIQVRRALIEAGLIKEDNGATY